MAPKRSASRGFSLLALGVVLAACDRSEPVTGPVERAAVVVPTLCDVRPNDNPKKLADCVRPDAVVAHLAAFQAIADANGGRRSIGTPGYTASVNYVVARLTEAGYAVTTQAFQFPAFFEISPTVLQQLSPLSVLYVRGVDHQVMSRSASGDVTASVTGVDLQLGLGNASTSGCEPADFAGFPAGDIALIQRGACTFEMKAENAAAAGASAVILFNQGNSADRTGLINGTLGQDYTGGIPVVEATYGRGVEWAGTPGLVMHILVQVFDGEATSHNIIAESATGDPANVVMIGGHLDSVDDGPGIQDNGSGAAVVLETAIQMARVKPRNKVRFAWWGAEEAGLIGSSHYVTALTDAQRGAIALYLNFDMVASPNFGYFVHDGDGSVGPFPGVTGSAAIETYFQNAYTQAGSTSKDSFELSDWLPFHAAGIPVGGVTTGSAGIKTPEEAALWGGTAGDQYDPCYHLACDTFANISAQALDQNSDIVAVAALTFAMSTEIVNGQKGKGNFKQKPGTTASTAQPVTF